jgi:hypothetical protein
LPKIHRTSIENLTAPAAGLDAGKGKSLFFTIGWNSYAPSPLLGEIKSNLPEATADFDLYHRLRHLIEDIGSW